MAGGTGERRLQEGAGVLERSLQRRTAGASAAPDYPRPQVQSFEGDRVSVKLPKMLRERLQKLAEKNGATLYMVLLSAYYTLLSKYSGQEDIIVGTPSAGRNHSDTEGLIGMFVNTLALRSSVKQDQTFAGLLGHVRKQVLDAFFHQDYPFEWLTEELNVPGT